MGLLECMATEPPSCRLATPVSRVSRVWDGVAWVKTFWKISGPNHAAWP